MQYVFSKRQERKILRMLDLILGKSQKDNIQIYYHACFSLLQTGNKHQSFALACAFELEAFNA